MTNAPALAIWQQQGRRRPRGVDQQRSIGQFVSELAQVVRGAALHARGGALVEGNSVRNRHEPSSTHDVVGVRAHHIVERHPRPGFSFPRRAAPHTLPAFHAARVGNRILDRPERW